MSKKITGTKEWAKYSANSTIGCSNNCKYCYARASYLKRGNTEPWDIERRDEERFNFNWDKRDGTIMFPTNHDITENNIDDAITVIGNILSNDNDILIVSKPSFPVMLKIFETFKDFKDKILFRFTIGSQDNNILSFWEPGASSYEERKKTLKEAYDRGFNTSVSMEPFLDVNMDFVIKTVKDLLPYCSKSLWIGKMNSIDKRVVDIDEHIINSYMTAMSNENILYLYDYFKNNSKINWKESIKKVVGLPLQREAGLDI